MPTPSVPLPAGGQHKPVLVKSKPRPPTAKPVLVKRKPRPPTAKAEDVEEYVGCSASPRRFFTRRHPSPSRRPDDWSERSGHCQSWQIGEDESWVKVKEEEVAEEGHKREEKLAKQLNNTQSWPPEDSQQQQELHGSMKEEIDWHTAHLCSSLGFGFRV